MLPCKRDFSPDCNPYGIGLVACRKARLADLLLAGLSYSCVLHFCSPIISGAIEPVQCIGLRQVPGYP